MANKIQVAISCVSALNLLIFIISALFQKFEKGPTISSTCDFSHAAVACDTETCSLVGRDILKDGGSAVDAAIATLLCIGVVHPQSTGLGGGAIFTIYENPGTVKVINARESVPKMYRRDLLKECTNDYSSLKGPQWIGVPGLIRGMEKAHSLYGRLPWEKLFEPAIKLAKEGVNVSEILSWYLNSPNLKNAVETSPLCHSGVLCDENETVLKTGDKMRAIALAQTMQIIAEKGASAFYNGSVTKTFIQDIQQNGGGITADDLESYRVQVTGVMKAQVGEYTMYMPPPPAGAALVSFVLNVMKGYNTNFQSVQGDQKLLTYHRYIEALKFANGQKKQIRDPEFNGWNDILRLISDEFADFVREMISPSETHPLPYYNITPGPSSDRPGTTHVAVIAEDGSVVSVTSTINDIFGSMVFSESTGVILNNQLTDFCGRAESINAGEKPPSSTSPVVLFSQSRNEILVIGGAGGSTITTSVVSAIMNYLWWGKNLTSAVGTPLVYVDSKNRLHVEENDFFKSIKENLKKFGHTFMDTLLFENAVNAISKKGNCINAVSDPRGKEKPAGY
ncbi:glutathione hydrolase 5 proenzyme-like [Lepisosteus oculatus]|uniref:Glutathione hydrolase n=1 Tax=Lepisosteus oculatus TaxID=7918 RepID=W5MUM1_LEPOC|nr:PREDICTED: gamma-glutamyltransferase 5-like [Lepisosteus oculatus]